MRAGPLMPSLTVEASFNGDTAELVVSGELDPATTTIVSDMLALALGRHPRTLVLRVREADPLDGAVAQMIADAASHSGTARPVIVWRSLPVRALLRRTGPGPSPRTD
jgi:anti-anti-sigma regulatory factor